MRAIEVREFGGPEVLTVAERERPRPGPNEVVVKVAAAGVNFMDIYQRGGAYQVPLPWVLGAEGAGTVAEVGNSVAGLSEGGTVAWASVPGSYAEYVTVPADRAVPVPDGVSAEVAAAVLLQGMTAHYLTESTYPVKKGDAVLIHAAAGGVGLLLVQLAKRRGARVIATVSTGEKERLAREAGADEVIRYTETDFTEEVRKLTAGEGVAAVYDGVGKETFDGSLASLRIRGTMALYGQSSGAVPPVDPQRLNSGGSLFLTRPTLAHYIVTTAELRQRAGDLFDAILAGELNVRIGGTYPLDDARHAHEDLAGRRTTGKLLLIP
jgi:NADPH2:quinone reductase